MATKQPRHQRSPISQRQHDRPGHVPDTFQDVRNAINTRPNQEQLSPRTSFQYASENLPGDGRTSDNNTNPTEYYYYNTEPNGQHQNNTYQRSHSPTEQNNANHYMYELGGRNGRIADGNYLGQQQQQGNSNSYSHTTGTQIPQLKRNPSHRKTSTPKKGYYSNETGEIIRAGSTAQNLKRNRQNQRNGQHFTSSNSTSDRKLSNSIALPIVPVRAQQHDESSFERKLSNSIAIPGLFDHDKNSGKGDVEDRTGNRGSSLQESGDAKNKNAKNSTLNQNKDSINDEKNTDRPSNIDETGENAKLLSVRRIDTPDRKNKGDSDDANSSSSSIPDNTDTPDVFLPKRYILAIMMFMGFVNLYAVRVNLNVAIGAMVNNHTVVRDGIAITEPPEFDWSSRLQGVILGSFYYGYMVLQIPGGYFAMRYGGTKIFGVAVFLASILTLLTPAATRYSVWALVVLRILEGLVLGVMLPCNHQIWSNWAPYAEKTTLVTIAIAGMNVGTVITMPLTGLLTKYGFDGGWASVFYCFGVVGIIWYILWVLVVHPTPGTHPTISKRERQYIENNTLVRKSMDVPWKTIFTSRPVWAVIIGNVANDWGLYTILICLPIFLMDIMKFNVQTMGFVASLPFLLKAIVGPVGGVIADILRYKYMTTANVRRLFFALGAMIAAILIVIAGYSHTPTVAVASMCIGVAMSGLLHSGYEVNVLDIAPGLSGIVMGITNTAGTTMGFLSPLFIGYMTENKLRSEWITVFWITFVFYAIGTVLFCLLLSGEAQHWAIDDEDEEARDQM